MENSMIKTENSISRRIKIGYGVGDFGANLVFQSILLFLMFYLTDVFGIAAPVAGTIFLVSKIWDGITDPMMGYISDRTNTRWGKKRPYLLFGSLPLGIALIMMFASPPLPEVWKPYYAAFSFLFLCTAYTVVNVPYGAMTASMTMDSKERSSITGYRMFFAIIGTLVVAGVTKPLAEQFFSSPVTGYRVTMSIYALLAVIFTLITFFTVKENITENNAKDIIKIKEIPGVIKNNPPFLLLSIGMIFHLSAIGMIAAMVNFYFKYNMNNSSFTTIAMLCLFVPAALALPLWVAISNKFNKKIAFNLGMGISAIMLLFLFFIRELNPSLLIPVFILLGVGISTIYLSPWAMIPDTVEYSEWKTGARQEGILYGFFYFSQKIAAALAGFISGQGLGLIGFNANTTQSPETLAGIRMLVTIVPIGLIILGMIFISFYPINNELHNKICKEIKNNN